MVFFGSVSGLNSSNTNLDIVDFIETALAQSGTNTFSCSGVCQGAFTPVAENQYTFTWSQVKFEVQPNNVPGPLPAMGAVAAFSFSRRLRARLRTARSATTKI